MTRIICISDTHEQHRSIKIPKCDLLIHGGDLTYNGSIKVIRDYNEWIGARKEEGTIKHSITICGNHDWCFEKPSEKHLARAALTNTIYLEDSGTEVMGLKIWGSPISPWFHSWAFNRNKGAEIKKHWDLIPRDIDILITHGPPYGYGDMTKRGERVGCEDLLTAIDEIKPKLLVAGHVHEDPGVWHREGIIIVNASSCNLQYNPVNPPIVVDIDV